MSPPARRESRTAALPILFLHGLGMSSRYLVPTLRPLADERVVWAPDLPGCGRSSPVARPLDVGEHAAAVMRWMDAVRIDRAVVVGHSVGAQIGAQLALDRPERVDRIILASPTGEPSRSTVHQAARLAIDTGREAPRLVPVAVRDYVRAGPLKMWRTFVLSRRHDLLECMRAIGHPTLVVRGTDDVVVSAGWAEAVAAAGRPGTELCAIPDAPHGLPFSASAAFAAIIGRFQPA